MRIVFFSTSISLFLSTTTFAAHSKTLQPTAPCTIFSPSSGSFYDLNTIAIQPIKDGKKAHKDDRTESWHAKGYDYGANFTLNFCAPVIEDLEDVVGVERALWQNVSAYYKLEGKTYSIGQQSSEPIFRGPKLVLNYTSGSPCTQQFEKAQKLTGHNDNDDDDDSGSLEEVQRKTTIISLLCERDSLAAKASVSFVGASLDECTYFFEARSVAACGGVSQSQQTLGPAGVFGVILLITAAVYLFGGIAYQRTVMHQRGWRQLPNYSAWAGIGSFIKDIFIITFSSCVRLLPRRKGYNQLAPHNTNHRGHADDENRLIDQLDEEWDD
ncbi:Cation-independent mannose-6-phosphate receptor CI-MPR [Toensbergia leucococca]|nr:Cation-independent mannose-6-phosphate receptor CI-MPR [Toensbergia leucococca]